LPFPPFAAAELIPPTMKNEMIIPNASTTAAAIGAIDRLFMCMLPSP
jgi:hypothetical protein